MAGNDGREEAEFMCLVTFVSICVWSHMPENRPRSLNEFIKTGFISGDEAHYLQDFGKTEYTFTVR